MAAGGLYSWEAPARPEDLALYAADGRPWLGSIAHERDSFVYRDVVDLDRLLAEVHGIKAQAEEG